MRARPGRAEAGARRCGPGTAARTAPAARTHPKAARLFAASLSALLPAPAAFAALSPSTALPAQRASSVFVIMSGALALAGVYALGRRAANARVAAATVTCVALHPAFFSQALSASATSAPVLLATALAAWGLFFYLPPRGGRDGARDGRGGAVGRGPLWGRSAGRLAALALALSLAAAAPLLFALRGSGLWPAGADGGGAAAHSAGGLTAAGYLTAVWGHLKLLTAAGGMWALTLGGLAAMLLRPRDDAGAERPRIAVPAQLAFAALAAAYAAALPLLGATGPRDALPALPPIILIWVSTLWRRVPLWPLAVALVCAVFALHIG